MNEFNPKDLAKLLRKPSGKYAKQIGETMFISNSNMIFKTIDCLQIKPNSAVLEIGFGNGKHIGYLMGKTRNLHYTGAEISEEMINEAGKNNLEFIDQKQVKLVHVNPNEKLDFGNYSFDYFFSVNTIYFIENIEGYFKNIYKLLNPNGKLALGFIDKEFAQKLSFTQEFSLYSAYTIEKLFHKIGFTSIEISNFSEHTISKDGQKINRNFIIISAIK